MNINKDMVEIRQAIAFYESRGWNWLSIVSFLSAKAIGHWPPNVIRTRIGGQETLSPKEQP